MHTFRTLQDDMKKYEQNVELPEDIYSEKRKKIVLDITENDDSYQWIGGKLENILSKALLKVLLRQLNEILNFNIRDLEIDTASYRSGIKKNGIRFDSIMHVESNKDQCDHIVTYHTDDNNIEFVGIVQFYIEIFSIKEGHGCGFFIVRSLDYVGRDFFNHIITRYEPLQELILLVIKFK